MASSCASSPSFCRHHNTFSTTSRRPPHSSITSGSHRIQIVMHCRPRYRLALCLLMLIMLVGQAEAVLVSTFDNCLSEFTRKSPTHLQFHPILVSASYDPVGQDENYLQITAWGTVTGASSSIPNSRLVKRDNTGEEELLFRQLEQPFGQGDYQWLNSGALQKRQSVGPIRGTDLITSTQAPPTYFGQYKADYRFPADDIGFVYTGSIVDQDSDAWGSVATTITTSIVVASFDVYKNKTFFCNNPSHSDSVEANCPFGNLASAGNSLSENNAEMKPKRVVPSQYRNDVAFLTRELPSFTINGRLASSYQFGTLGVTIKIISGDRSATHIGCLHVEITPELEESYSRALTWISVGVLMLVGIASILAAMYNPWNGSTDIFKFSCNYGMDEDMIRLITPGFADCLQWLQFIVLTGSLALTYPGFYQPVVSRGAWSALLLNTSLYSHEPVKGNAWRGDGIYAPEAWTNGFERMAQAVGLLTTEDIWISVISNFVILVVASILIFEVWFWGRWVMRKIIGVEEEDLTNRNLPFTIGLIYRFTFTYFYIPILTVCAFQFTVAAQSPAVLVVLAGVVLVLLLSLGFWLTLRIWRHKPRAGLFDDLPRLLKYGTFYNTYREKHLQYFIVQLVANFLRAVAFGGLQVSGIAQVSILAVCEILTILTLYGIQPFAPATSMNMWHTIFSVIRLITILLMMAFIPSISASDAVKSWAGWIILGIHALVLLFGFVLKSMQTLLELAVRGYRHDEEAVRGGFAKVFGVRQLSRRKRHPKQTNRSASLSPPMNERKHTLSIGPRRPHSRSNSSAILLGSPAIDRPGLFAPPDGSQSQSGHGHSNSGSTAGALTPTTHGVISGYGYLPPVDTTTGPYYRPPRTRRVDSDQFPPAGQSRQSWGSDHWQSRQGRSSQGSLPANILDNQAPLDPEWGGGDLVMPSGPVGQTSVALGHRYTESAVTVGSGRGNTDYTVREVDFYYGVRGPALSTQPATRRLGTGPADPTGPISNAKSWVKKKLGLARGEKEKGFSVVRSSRAPDAIINTQREVEQEANLEGIEPIDIGMAITSTDQDSYTGDDQAADSDSDSDFSGVETEEPGPSTRMLETQPSSGKPSSGLARHPSNKPSVPRKSSKRKSSGSSAFTIGQKLYDPPIQKGSTSRLPFEADTEDHTDERSISLTSSLLEQIPAMGPGDNERPDSVGEVHHGRVSAVLRDERGDIRGSRAELVRGGSHSTGDTGKSGGSGGSSGQ